MTNRDFFNSVIAGSISDEVKTKAQAMLEALDSKNASRKVANADKKAEEYAPLVKAFVEFLNNATEPMRASDIANALGVSTSKVPHIAKRVPSVVKTEIKVKGSRAVIGYALGNDEVQALPNEITI